MDDHRTRDRVLAAAIAAGVPTVLWGEPGTGKTARISALAQRLGRRCVTVLGSIREPSDFNGLPVRTADGDVVMAPPRWARELASPGGAVLFLDELSTAPPATQAAMLRVVDERVVGDVPLPGSVSVVAAANDVDVAAGGWELAPPLANRMLHLDWPLRTEDWLTGMTVGWHAVTPSGADLGIIEEPDAATRTRARLRVASFLTVDPTSIQAYPRTDPVQAGRAWPSGRSWDRLAHLLAHLPPADEAATMLAAVGMVGEAAAVAFLSWLRENDLPDPGLVLDDPASYDWSDPRTDRTMTVLRAVAAVAIETNTVDAWQRAWNVVERAATAGSADVAATVVRLLLTSRPEGAPLPSSISAFTPLLRRAGALDAVGDR